MPARSAPSAFLDWPVDRAARWMGLWLLDAARATRARLDDPEDASALHDHRVALRRLRSWLRAFRGHLADEPSRRTRAGLRALAAETGPSRDAEVQAQWLRGALERFPARQRAATALLLSRFEEERAEGAKVVARSARRFDALAPRLERELTSYRPRVNVRAPEAEPRGSAVMARIIREQAEALRERLAMVKSRADESHAHEARIEGKRLRHVLEPLRGHVRGAREAVTALKALQDVLGELHDAHVLAGVARRRFPAAPRPASPAIAAGPRPAAGGAREARGAGSTPLSRITRTPRTPRPPAGVAALRAIVAERESQAFAALERRFLPEGLAVVLERAEKVASALEARALEGVEIERKFLLSGLPPRARRARHVTIDQGYLPGRVIGERIRRVRDGRRIDHVRSLKAGRGMVRMELEEATDASTFAGLWRLTRGRRLKKRRHAIPEGPLTWEIDVFLDRDLVLAEVELTSRDAEVPIPDWLAPHIVREVTDERRYENHQIALSSPGRGGRRDSGRSDAGMNAARAGSGERKGRAARASRRGRRR